MEDAHRMGKHSRLPHTSRVNEKIIDYYTKFGRERDLEKFMRLYSPAGSQQSQRSRSPMQQQSATTTTSGSSCCASEDGACCGATLRRLFRERAEAVISASKSLPNIGSTAAPKEINIPIRLEGGSDEKQQQENSTSSDELHTPQKAAPSESKATKTPDSVTKIHKRLEWDSLGDVGYIKSMSTSNISVLERTLLKELFQETSTATTSVHKLMHTNASEGDLKQLQKGLERGSQEKSMAHSYNTPPLASSTFAEARSKAKLNVKESSDGGARPKYTTQGTSTSLQKQFEKSAQTSFRHAHFSSQEVQVDINSAATSLIGSSATPSSFSYYSSRSSRSTTTSNDGDAAADCNAQRRRADPPPHPFISGISELLASRKVLAGRNKGGSEQEATHLQQLHDTLKQALSENKENNSDSVASLLCSPQLDLGIQLLCSLIDAKSLSSKQKKQLVRDIVRRISLLSDSSSSAKVVLQLQSASSSQSSNRTTNATTASARHKARQHCAGEEEHEKSQLYSCSTADGMEQILKKEVFKKPSLPETSARAMAALNAARSKDAATSATQAHVATDVPKLAAKAEPVKRAEIDKQMQIDISHETAETTEASHKATAVSAANNSSPSITNTNTTATSSSTKEEPTTQKEAALERGSVNSNNTAADAEQASMREWLNPLTQSEIEYEDRKRLLAKTAAKREREQKAHKTDTERAVQLNWIDTEIQRLESLRHLLLKEHNNRSDDTPMSAPTNTAQTQKHYDTVCSTSSTTTSTLGTSAERLVQEIEVIIEESNEDVVNLDDNCKCTKERKRETQIYYDKPTEAGLYDAVAAPQGKARFRTVKETITTNEEQLLGKATARQAAKPATQQRSKIDTPSIVGSTESESVRSFVQQRKREFMEQYRSKRHSQQEPMQYLDTNRRASAAAPDISGHYSVPHTMPRRHVRDEYTQPTPPAPPPPLHYATTASHGNKHAKQPKLQPQQQHQQSSSSSMLGVSSEMSIPMGSHDSSSTPTTTHQYDDVAAAVALGIGVAVQTSDSVLRTQPIFGPPRYMPYCAPSHVLMSTSSTTQTACVQVKPKGIAYVIQFSESSKTTTTTSTSSNMPPTTSSTTANIADTAEPTPLTLQDHLARARPEFLAHTKERKAILNQLQSLRQEREREMREIVDNASISSLDRHLNGLPPPATKQIRVFPTREMKALTSKHFAQLPEVLEREQRDREERNKRGNRVLRDVFNRRLQKRVRSGKLSLNHSRTVI